MSNKNYRSTWYKATKTLRIVTIESELKVFIDTFLCDTLYMISARKPQT